MDNYLNVVKIGQGSFGTVFRATDRSNGKIIALKKTRTRPDSDGVPVTAMREIAMLQTLKHPNVVQLLKVFLQHSNIYLVFEYMDMDLRTLIKTNEGTLRRDLIKSYMRQLLDGLAYCHGRRIMHRDLKPHNLLVDTAGHIKLADFGLSRAFGAGACASTHKIVTLRYRAPELLLGANFYTTSIDMWSVGCIFAEMLSGKTLFKGHTEISQLYRMFRALGTPGFPELWPAARRLPDYSLMFPQWQARAARRLLPVAVLEDQNAIQLFETMLRYDPKERITARYALQHPYLRNAKLVPPDHQAID